VRLKEEVVQLREWKRQLNQMLVSLSVVFIVLVGVWLMGMGSKAMH
jgi:predicted nucleic acid-binding Zn ribbon protein